MKIAVIEYQYYKDRRSFDSTEENLDRLADRRILITNHSSAITGGKTVVLNHTNQGKDIGAKLIGIDYLLATGSDPDLVFFLHDKRSPHSPLGDFWHKKLTRIFHPTCLPVLKQEMAKPQVGICCTREYIKTEFNRHTGQFDTPNNAILQQLIREYGLNPPKPNYFVAGTIFSCKWEPLKKFFTRHPPLGIRRMLEKGNVQDMEQGTFTHSWERLFTWLITSQGYSIKGI